MSFSFLGHSRTVTSWGFFLLSYTKTTCPSITLSDAPCQSLFLLFLFLSFHFCLLSPFLHRFYLWFFLPFLNPLNPLWSPLYFCHVDDTDLYMLQLYFTLQAEQQDMYFHSNMIVSNPVTDSKTNGQHFLRRIGIIMYFPLKKIKIKKCLHTLPRL